MTVPKYSRGKMILVIRKGKIPSFFRNDLYHTNIVIMLSPCVLGSARTGLIFTRNQEGAQPGGLTPPGQTEPGIPYYVLSCWVPVGGGSAAGTHSRLGSARRRSCPGERLCGSCGSCRVFSLSVSLLFLFPLFAVLLNCPYPDPPVSACFFPFSSASWQWEGRQRGAFVVGCSQNQNTMPHSSDI